MARILLNMCVLLGACQTPTSAPAPPPPAPPTTAAPDAHAQLATMDGRSPVPLLPMMANHQKQQMRDHLVVIQEVVGALATEDWAAVEASARRMGSSPQMAMTCEHMGAGAPGFTERALDFHQRADGIAAAAQNRDAAAVPRATHHTLEACTSCHAAYQQEVLGSADYEAKTGSAGPH